MWILPILLVAKIISPTLIETPFFLNALSRAFENNPKSVENTFQEYVVKSDPTTPHLEALPEQDQDLGEPFLSMLS